MENISSCSRLPVLMYIIYVRG